MHGGQVGKKEGRASPSGARHAGWKNPKFGPDLGKRGSDQARRGKLAFAGTSPTVGSFMNYSRGRSGMQREKLLSQGSAHPLALY